MVIKKMKFRDGMFATVEYREEAGYTNDDMTRVCNNPVTEEFKETLQVLGIHCILICELVDVEKVKGDLANYHPKMLEFVTVKGISWGGDDGEGVTLSFERKLSTGRVLNLNTPFTKFNDEQIVYKFDEELQEAIAAVEEKIEAYLGGEYGEGAQLGMDLPEAKGELEHV